MLTIKLNISYCSDRLLLSEYVSAYTNLFYKLYNNPELMVDEIFINSLLNDYIDKSIYDYCVIDVKTKLAQYQTTRNKKFKEIINITKQLELNDFTTKRERIFKYKLINKLANLKRNIDKQIVFGGKSLLREITKLSQKNDKTNEDILLLENKKKLFKNKRNLGIYLIGKACENGNRKVNFDLINNKIIFKPKNKTKIEILFNIRGKVKDTLITLQKLSELKSIPLTIRLTNNSINISYNEELINGYSFNDIECNKEQKNSINKDEKKQIFIKYKREQENRKQVNKINNRYLSIDLNPNYIGFVIFDKINNKQELLHKELIDLTKLNNRLKIASNNKKQVGQNNKRKYEITQIWKYIFGLVKHYKVYNIVIEDLDFKPNNKDGNVEFNRQTKNLWHRTLTTNLINKYCNIIGLNKIEINPCYTSFIGNMIHSYPDPVSASIEIGRRGMNKYNKGYSIYPEISLINQEKLNYLLGENIDIQGFSWKQIYKITSLLRYRNPINIGLKDNNLYSYKSKISRFIY